MSVAEDDIPKRRFNFDAAAPQPAPTPAGEARKSDNAVALLASQLQLTEISDEMLASVAYQRAADLNRVLAMLHERKLHVKLSSSTGISRIGSAFDGLPVFQTANPRTTVPAVTLSIHKEM